MTLVAKSRKLPQSSHYFPILLYIPPDILTIILYSDSLSSADLRSLSLVNTAHRSLLLPYIFRGLTIPWHEISLFLQKYTLPEPETEINDSTDSGDKLRKSKNEVQSKESSDQQDIPIKSHESPASSPKFLTLPFIQSTTTSLEISQPNSSLEWKLNKEVDMIVNDYLPHLQHLKINFTSGSFPLKYLRFRKKKSLRSFTISTLRPGSIFNLEHLSQISQIETLVLQNFKLASPSSFQAPASKFVSINTGVVSKVSNVGLQENKLCSDLTTAHSNIPSLTSLKIIDCSWDFPTNLDEFDYNNKSIRSIHLTFTNNNNFILSERFKYLLLNPMISKNLQEFELNLQDNAQLIKYANIESYLNFEALKTLKTVKLIGMPFSLKSKFLLNRN